MSSFQIRKADPQDSQVIARFNQLMARETEQKGLDPETLLKGVLAVLQDESKGLYYLAEENGIVVGQLMITYEWSDWRNGMFWWIQSVYVEETSRKKGVYRALHEHVLRLAKKTSGICGLRLYVDAHNKHAKETYTRLGMTKTEYELFEIDFVL